MRFSAGDRALYASGGSNYRQVPIGIVIPRTVEDVVTTVAVCRELDAPVLSRGGGTSLAGQCVNVAVVIDFSKYLNRILEIDPDAAARARRARADPRPPARAGAARHGLTYGPDPSTHNHCTLGGMIGNNSCGTHSVMSEFHGPGPLTADQVVELEVLDLPRRAVPRRARRPRCAAGARRRSSRTCATGTATASASATRPSRAASPATTSTALLPEHGFNLAAALTGTESTCVTILEATVELIPSPRGPLTGRARLRGRGDRRRSRPRRSRARAARARGRRRHAAEDMKLVGLHDEELHSCRTGGASCSSSSEATRRPRRTRRRTRCSPRRRSTSGLKGAKLYDDRRSEQHIWDVREAGLGATAFVPGKPDTYEGWEDSAVPPERVGDYLRSLGKLATKYGYESALYGHYGQGCIHARWNWDLVTREGIRTFRRFLDEASDLVLSLGGSLSGEHGDGQSRAELLPKMFGDDLVEGFREFKSIWDPDWQMNPGKVVDPYPITENLRLGTGYRAAATSTHFAYPDDGGSFAHATTRCVGIGNCRRTDGGVMCPSFQVSAGGEALDARPRANPLGDAERRRARALAAIGRSSSRSTSASPARAARATAPSRSTCRR